MPIDVWPEYSKHSINQDFLKGMQESSQEKGKAERKAPGLPPATPDSTPASTDRKEPELLEPTAHRFID